MCGDERPFSRNRTRCPTAKKRIGSTLLEVMGATICASMMLVPTATMLSDAHRWTIRTEQQGEILSLLDGCVQEYQYLVAGNFRSGQTDGNFASRGFPGIRFSAVYSDAAAQGGIPNRFMVLRVTAWSDLNNNASWDPGEPRQQINTGVSRRR